MAPNPCPEIVTGVPTGPSEIDRLVITGGGVDGVLTETLSNVAVVSGVELLVTANPIYTFCAITIV